MVLVLLGSMRNSPPISSISELQSRTRSNAEEFPHLSFLCHTSECVLHSFCVGGLVSNVLCEHIYRGLTCVRYSWKLISLKYKFYSTCLKHRNHSCLALILVIFLLGCDTLSDISSPAMCDSFFPPGRRVLAHCMICAWGCQPAANVLSNRMYHVANAETLWLQPSKCFAANSK